MGVGMEKHLLVTVSGEESAMHGIRFILNFFKNRQNLRLTLFYAATRPPEVWEHEKNFETLNEQRRMADKAEAKGRKALEEARTHLCSLELCEEQVDAKLMFRKDTKAMDILREGEEGLYDAIVLGRRGLTRIEQLVEDSVSMEIIGKQSIAPMWICRWPEKHRQHVLLCLDGSDASYRMADHVGFMVAEEKHHHVRLLRVIKPGTRSHRETEEIFSRAAESLLENGVDESRIRMTVRERNTPWRAIMEEAEDGMYAAVALGRTGAGGGMFKRLFMGSTTINLMRELAGAVLWVRP
ncbi:universal stress protein [Desulfobaculum senezii]